MVRLAPVDAPTPERPLVNLLGAARTPTDNVRWQEGTQYESQSCSRLALADTCEPATNAEVRAGVGPDDPTGRLVQAVAVYAVVDYDCIALPNLLDSYRDRVLAALDAELPRAVEHELWTGVIAQAAALPSRWLASSDTIDVNPAGAVSPNRATGLLERALGDVYSGVGIIHIPRDVTPYLSHTTRNGRVIETRAGNRVVPGVGYPGVGVGIGRPGGVVATPNLAGGTLADDTYEYVVTATSATGETLPSAQASATVAATVPGTGSVDLTWDAVTDATGYRIYGRQAGALVLLGTNASGDETFTDTGAAAAGPDTPPTVNTSGTAEDGEAWAYVTPMVTVRVGSPEVLDNPTIDRDTNRAHVIARQPFEVSWDGCTPAFAVRVALA